jgi:hypothetical protein
LTLAGRYARPLHAVDEGATYVMLRLVCTALLLLSLNPVSFCQQSGGNEKTVSGSASPVLSWGNQETPAIRAFMRPTPAEYMKAIDESRRLLRAKIALDNSTTVEFYEKPTDIDFYDSTVVVSRQGKTSRTYEVGRLVGHQALSLAHVAIVLSGRGAGILVCEYEGGAVGAKEGFAILRFSPSGFELLTLPLADFGKIVVFQSKLDQAEIWSALLDYVGADAEPRSYATRTCHWRTEGYVCDPAERKQGRFAPADVNDPGIEIRP